MTSGRAKDGFCRTSSPSTPGSGSTLDHASGRELRIPGRSGHTTSSRRAHDDRMFHILSVIDEGSRECLALPVTRRLRSEDVLAALAELFVTRGPPTHTR